MITTHDASTNSQPEAAQKPAVRLHWYIEIALVIGFYAVYSVVRNQFGSASVHPREAFTNALHVIRFERALDLFVEVRLQETFLGWRPFMQAWNVFYGTFHFVVTAGVMIFLFRRVPGRYRHWRTILGFTTAVALLGFSLFPLMPPRLLGDFGPFGGHSLQYRFIDSLADFGGLWSFNSGGMKSLSNQYAAMPSLHIAWATWCALAIRPVLRRRWTRALFIVYPFVTLFAVVVTANHYWLDGLGGLIALALGAVLTLVFEGVLGRIRHGWARHPEGHAPRAGEPSAGEAPAEDPDAADPVMQDPVMQYPVRQDPDGRGSDTPERPAPDRGAPGTVLSG